jgi:hypothetical protein
MNLSLHKGNHDHTMVSEGVNRTVSHGFARTQKRRHVVLSGVLSFCSLALGASFSPCDLNQDGVVDNADITLAVNMALGTISCTANVEGPNTCTVITVQRVVNAAHQGTCIAYNAHGVTLNWVSSISPNVIGYNVYRGAALNGPFRKLNFSPVSGNSYVDGHVRAGQTYYYVATAVDSSGTESSYSAAVSARIPTP